MQDVSSSVFGLSSNYILATRRNRRFAGTAGCYQLLLQFNYGIYILICLVLICAQRNANELDSLTYIFSGASLLLYALCKAQNGDMDDLIPIEPLEIKQEDTQQPTPRGSRGSISLGRP